MRLIDADTLVEKCGDYYVEEGPEDGFIGTLKTLIDMQHTIGGWVSVKDRLPKKPDGYPHSEIRRSYFLVALESGCVKSLGFDFDRMEWHYTGSPVTHWMPLPEPPRR